MEMRDEDLAGLPPTRHEHLNRPGKYGRTGGYSGDGRSSGLEQKNGHSGEAGAVFRGSFRVARCSSPRVSSGSKQANSEQSAAENNAQ